MSEPGGKPLLKSHREPLLHIGGLTVDFDTEAGWVRGLHGVDLEVYPGEILGLVGESGSGKSITCMAVMRLLGPRARIQGDVLYRQQNLLGLDAKGMTQIRGAEIAMIFQDPTSSLNPVHTIGRQVIESVVLNAAQSMLNPSQTIGRQIGDVVEQHRGLTGEAARDETVRLLDRVGIPKPKERLRDYPHQLSGGMNQRVMISMALAGHPRLLIADEPTTALDVTIQAQILELIRRLREEMGMSIILITHDLAVVAETCDRVAVMYCGRIVEKGNVEEMFAEPRHPYTRGLLESLPRIDRQVAKLYPIEGTVPAPHELPLGCAFEPRCPYALKECKLNQPALETGDDERAIACFNPQSGGPQSGGMEH
ncbi:MAG: ABC transporter ATP-binding protein [Proteobacteria bacterium]|nr:ABC transporter ATP-binding protein [Pseudomonadota bacterium]